MSNQEQVKKPPQIKGDVYIYSTLSNDHVYANYIAPVSKREQKLTREKIANKNGVFIKGGANVRRIADSSIVTPRGVATKVTETEYGYLCKCAGFISHWQAGYISIDGKKHEAKDVAKDMKSKDKSAQKTKEDFKKAPKVGEDK